MLLTTVWGRGIKCLAAPKPWVTCKKNSRYHQQPQQEQQRWKYQKQQQQTQQQRTLTSTTNTTCPNKNIDITYIQHHNKNIDITYKQHHNKNIDITHKQHHDSNKLPLCCLPQVLPLLLPDKKKSSLVFFFVCIQIRSDHIDKTFCCYKIIVRIIDRQGPGYSFMVMQGIVHCKDILRG